ncbi:MAG: hypothetical protein R2729_18235 [Bryobacteraceae bacterium]
MIEPLRVSVSGLLPNDQIRLGRLLEQRRVEVVDNDSYQAILVDMHGRDCTQLLRERAWGSVVVTACRRGHKEPPGTVRLDLPETEDGLERALGDVRAMVALRAPTRRAEDGNERMVGSSFTGLTELASRYRAALFRYQFFVVLIDNERFHIFPQQGVITTAIPAADCLNLRRGATIQVLVPWDQGSGAEQMPFTHRLDSFLWRVGHLSSGGKLLPWLDQRRAYRLNRWPPVVREAGDSSLVKLGTIIARRALAPAEISDASGQPLPRVADFLNGCSVAGCLDVYDPVEAPAPRGNTTRNKLFASLFGKIRSKLGLT